MKKIASDSLNPGKLSKNFKATIQQLIAQDRAYSFMSSIKGAPAYWEKIFIWSAGNGKAAGYSNIFYDFIMCRSTVKWISGDYFKV